MKLAPNSRRAIEVEQLANGMLRLHHRLRVGNSGSKDLAPAKDYRSWPEVYAAIEVWAQEELARAGLEAVKGK